MIEYFLLFHNWVWERNKSSCNAKRSSISVEFVLLFVEDPLITPLADEILLNNP